MLAIVLVLLTMQLPLFYYTFRRSGFVPFPHLLLFYLMGCEVSIYLVAGGVADYPFLVIYSSYAFESHYYASQIFFATLFLFAFAVFLPPPNVRYLSRMERTFSRARTIKIPISTQGVWVGVAALWLYHLFLFMALNWSLVWKNDTYLLMNGERVLAFDNPITKFLIGVFPFSGLLIFILLGVYAWKRGQYIAAALLPLGLFDLLYQVGAHSRKSVLYILAFAGLSYMVRKDRTTAIVGAIIALITLLFCLGGRNYHQHGVSTLFMPFTILAAYFERNSFRAVFNLFEGGFNTTELFTRSYSSSTKYKIMSFLPLPSVIDGFNKIRDVQMHRLGPFSPPSAIFEVWSFGGIWILWFLFIQVTAGRIVVRLFSGGSDLIAMAANALMALATYLQFTYPMRPVNRFMVFALLLGLIGRAVARHRTRTVVARRGPRPRGGMPNGRRPALHGQARAGPSGPRRRPRRPAPATVPLR